MTLGGSRAQFKVHLHLEALLNFWPLVALRPHPSPSVVGTLLSPLEAGMTLTVVCSWSARPRPQERVGLWSESLEQSSSCS